MPSTGSLNRRTQPLPKDLRALVLGQAERIKARVRLRQVIVRLQRHDLDRERRMHFLEAAGRQPAGPARKRQCLRTILEAHLAQRRKEAILKRKVLTLPKNSLLAAVRAIAANTNAPSRVLSPVVDINIRHTRA